MKPWTYVQESGALLNPAGALVATGYSGNGKGLNNPGLQHLRGVGPIPQGKYTCATPTSKTHLGPDAIPLAPFPDNTMFGRDQFYCHGDNAAANHSASEGCIIMPPAARALLGPGSVIQVIARVVAVPLPTPGMTIS